MQSHHLYGKLYGYIHVISCFFCIHFSFTTKHPANFHWCISANAFSPQHLLHLMEMLSCLKKHTWSGLQNQHELILNQSLLCCSKNIILLKTVILQSGRNVGHNLLLQRSLPSFQLEVLHLSLLDQETLKTCKIEMMISFSQEMLLCC